MTRRAQVPPGSIVMVTRTCPGRGSGVLVLCDGSAESRAVLRYAWNQAERLALPLTVVPGLPDPPAALGRQDATSPTVCGRMPASVGASLLALERLLLRDLVEEMRTGWAGVAVRVVDEATADDVLARGGRSADLLVAGASHARRIGELALAAATADDIECVTVVLPEEDRASLEVGDPRVLMARLIGVARRLTVIGVSADQAVRELLTITRDHELMAQAGATALKGWGAGATHAWHPPEVAELLIRAAVETLSANAEASPMAGDVCRRDAS